MPISSKPIIFLAFSNDPKNNLSKLADERIAILNILQPLVDQNQCELLIEGAATPEDIFRVFSQRKNRNRITIFHYAGHADGNGIHTVSTEGDNQTTYASGLAKLFGMQKNLKLVFLNGCSTKRQVEVLQSEGILNVIATSVSIGDKTAMMLAEQFYATFAQNESIDNAFKTAYAFIEGKEGDLRDSNNSRKLWKDRKEEKKGLPWENYFKKGDWRLANFRPINEPFKIFLAYSFLDDTEKKKLDRQLAVLQRRKMIDVFSETGVEAGSDTNKTIMNHLNTAHIILLLVTDNLFFDAGKLIDEAVERYERDAVTLIPVYLKKCVIEDEKFAQLQPLPGKHLHNGKIWRFVNEWDNEDMAYYEIAVGLRNLIVSLKKEQN
ncbi:MAG: CHAT domain-containing protein [Chitinophagales bacterium]